MKKYILAITIALLLTPTASHARGKHYGYQGGHYAGGHGSSHKGGHYRNARTGNHYSHHSK